jgi:hypothetical protein
VAFSVIKTTLNGETAIILSSFRAVFFIVSPFSMLEVHSLIVSFDFLLIKDFNHNAKYAKRACQVEKKDFKNAGDSVNTKKRIKHRNLIVQMT